MGKPILTVGIPTFNRRKVVTSCLENIEKDGLLENLEILVIDNFSVDGTFKSLLKKFKQKNLRILQNHENIGFSGNTLELIKQCETDYLLWNPDEDKIIKSNVDPLIEFLNEKKPKMLCPHGPSTSFIISVFPDNFNRYCHKSGKRSGFQQMT